MLRSEINELENSVGDLLKNNGTTNPASYQKRIAEQVAHVQNNCSDLKKKWIHELLSSAKEQVIRRYVQFHQAGIIQLSDEVSRREPAYIITDEIRALANAAYTQVNQALEDVLEFLQHQFYPYFDIDHQASIYHCHLVTEKIAAFGPDLNFFKNNAIDGTLINCVLTSVQEILSEGSISGVSYRQADQCLNLVRLTHQLLFLTPNTTTESLAEALYQQNMNTLHFFDWYRNYFSALLTGQKERNDFINAHLRTLTVFFVSPEKALQPELPSTNSYIIS